MQGRGQLTERIKQRSKELLGYEITQKELRLMAYVQYVLYNTQKIDPKSLTFTTILISSEERDILKQWGEKGYIKGVASGLSITKEFWDMIHEIIFLGYVDID